MKQFAYKARDSSGTETQGVVESLSDKAAVRTLQERGLLVVSLSQKRVWDWSNLTLGVFGSRVSSREIATFTQFLATMLSTGLPLSDALENLAMQTTNGYFREVIRSLVHDVQSGISLSDALGRFPKLFDTLYVNLIKAGEASGKMDEVMAKLAETLEANLDFKAKVSGALTYPAVVTVVMVGVAVFMLTTVIPRIAEVYKQFGADLPLPTRILIGLASLVTNYFLVAVILVALLVFGVRTLLKNPTSEYLLNNLSFRLPVFGPLNAEMTVAIVARTLGMLLYSGVAILDALAIMARAVPNNYFRSGLLEARELVEKGLPFSLAMRRNPNFPPLMSQLLAIGEETGTVDQSLGKVAKYYQDITERKTKTLTSLLEPVLLIIMGTLVGGMAIAVLLPMFNLISVIK